MKLPVAVGMSYLPKNRSFLDQLENTTSCLPVFETGPERSVTSAINWIGFFYDYVSDLAFLDLNSLIKLSFVHLLQLSLRHPQQYTEPKQHNRLWNMSATISTSCHHVIFFVLLFHFYLIFLYFHSSIFLLLFRIFLFSFSIQFLMHF